MDRQCDFQLTFDFSTSKPILVEPSAAQLTSDAGLLPIRQLDEKLGLTQQFVDALSDRRHQGYIDHSFLEMTRMRVYGILADYVDQNDHDVLRSDPAFKLICDRSINDDDLASQPTLSRFENAIGVKSFFHLRDLLIDQFIASFDEPPKHLTLDIDPFDDPTHGEQQLTFFHGYYDQYQYLPRAITCAENDLVVMICLLFGTAHASLGAADDIEYLVGRLREAWPGVDIHVRADTGFAVPEFYERCEQLNVFYSIGFMMNPRMKKLSKPLQNVAISQYEATGQPQRLFGACWYKAENWPAQRWVIFKAEAHSNGTNRRAIITNRPGAFVLPDATYESYTDRGESENRNKELKCGLQADRLSDHRYFANLFRLYLHTLAYNLLVRVRQEVANPLPAPKDPDDIPVEAFAGYNRRQYQNRRRKHDPLGEGQPCTWRTRLIKVAAIITESTRRVVVHLSSSWPYLNHYEQVSSQVLAFDSS